MRITDLYENNLEKYYYHGTSVKFDKFDPDIASRVQKDGLLYGPGYYFTDDFSYAAKRYMGRDGGVWKVKIRDRRVLNYFKNDFSSGDINFLANKVESDSKELIFLKYHLNELNNFKIIITIFEAFDFNINKTCKFLTEIGVDALFIPEQPKKNRPEMVVVYSANSIIQPKFYSYDEILNNMKQKPRQRK